MKTTNKRRILGLFLLIPMIIALLLGGCGRKTENSIMKREVIDSMRLVFKTTEGYKVYKYSSEVDYPVYMVVDKEGKPIAITAH